MYDPLKPKYFGAYMAVADVAKVMSLSAVSQVGAVVVLPTGVMSMGWNGTPPGEDNCCEDHTKLKIDEVTGLQRHPTKDNVIHAEMNVLKKCEEQGIPLTGGILFTTLSPCEKCCEALSTTGIKAVYYSNEYKNTECLQILTKAGIDVARI